MSAYKTDYDADPWWPGIKSLLSDSPKELVKVLTKSF